MRRMITKACHDEPIIEDREFYKKELEFPENLVFTFGPARKD
jgi:hypothetical protein